MTGPTWRDAHSAHLIVASELGDTFPLTACQQELRFVGAPPRIAWGFVTCPTCLTWNGTFEGKYSVNVIGRDIGSRITAPSGRSPIDMSHAASAQLSATFHVDGECGDWLVFEKDTFYPTWPDGTKLTVIIRARRS